MVKNILLTGSTGFLGKEILSFLEKSNHKVDTLGRSKKNTICCDFSSEVARLEKNYDVLVHVAGKAHVLPKKKEEYNEFLDVNYRGTENLLKSISGIDSISLVVFISSVAVYGLDYGENINEEFPLKGESPYAKSKILAEKAVIKFSKKKNINYVILRLPLISGINPPGNLKSMITAIKNGYYFRIGDGLSRKSMVSSTDIAKLIPHLKNKNGIYNLTDRVHPRFKDVELKIADFFDRKIISLPKFFFLALAKIGDVLPFFIFNSQKLNKITKSLTFSDDKAVKELNWNPSSALDSLNVKNE